MTRFWRKFLANRGGAIGLAIMLLVLAVAVGAPWLFPGDPLDAVARPLLPPFEDARFLLGADRNGRDIAAGIAHGARVSLMIGVTAAAGAVLIGTVIGALAGFYRGWIDELLMRVVEAFQTVPGFVLALALVAVLGPSSTSSIVAVAVISWTQTARVVRAEFLALRERDFVRACTALGASDITIMVRHILPNAISTLVVIATLDIASAIRTEAGLSFLGLGVPPPTPSWGNILSEGRQYIKCCTWLTTYSGLAIMLAVLAFNLMGDALRDLLDPRLRGE